MSRARLNLIGHRAVYVVSHKLRQQDLMRIRRHVGIGLNVLLVTLFAVLLYRNKDAIPLVAHVVTPLTFGACFLLYLASLLVQFWIWLDLMDYRRGERTRALEEYIRTILMGRLPGGVWKLLGRLTIYRTPRLSSKSVFIVNLIELFVALFANGVIMLFLGVFSWSSTFAILGITFTLFVVLAVRWRSVLSAVPQGHKPRHWLLWVGGYIMAWICGGLIVYLVVKPFAPFVTVAEAIRYWCIVGAIGLVLQVLPLSMLISDATMVALLQPSMQLSRALIVTFAVRLLMMGCELLNAWLLLGVAGRVQRQS